MKYNLRALSAYLLCLFLASPGLLLARLDGVSPPDSIVSVFFDFAYIGTNLVVIVPTGEEDKTAQQRIQDYVMTIYANWGQWVEFLTDQEALTQSLAEKHVLAYGTMTGNLWLAEHATSLPIKVESDYIDAGEIVEGTDLRLIAVWNNPEDPDRGLVIYTAQQAAQVVGIHDIQTGASQFLIAREQQALRQGFYLRTEFGWSFSDYPDFCPDLTDAQKLEDFDTFEQIIRDVFPTAHANKVVFGLDIDEIFSTYRAGITDTESTLNFVDILDRTIKACKGSHLDTDYVISAYYASNNFLRSYAADYLNEEIVRIHQFYISHLLTLQPNNTVRLNIPLIYYDGDYYIRHDFSFAGRDFTRGLKVETCNGWTPDEIVINHQDSLAMLPWDFRRSKFYYTRFYAMGVQPIQGNLDFVFRAPDETFMYASFPVNESITFEIPERRTGRAVIYLPQSKLLYIRIPSMTSEDIPFYEEGILREGRTSRQSPREVRAAVVDIRNNGGGSDSVWNSVLRKLLDRSVTYESSFGVRNTPIVRSYVSRHSSGQSLLQQGRTKVIAFLGDQEFLTATSQRILSPAPDSIRVPKIYVLSDNVYSAAGSLTTLAGLVDPIVSVGYTNPHILGMGIDPFHFSLPHSSYAFTIEPVVDLTGCTSAPDVFHVHVEVEVQSTLDQVLEYANQPTDGSLEDFLTRYDPVFQEVLRHLETAGP